MFTRVLKPGVHTSSTLLKTWEKVENKTMESEKESKTAAAFMHHSMPPCNVTDLVVDIVTGESNTARKKSERESES